MGPRPRLAVLAVGDVVGRRPWRRRGPLLERLRARVEHGDPVAAVLAEPETVLGVYHAAARGRARRRRREERDLPGPGVDAPDVLLGEVREERVVLGVGDDVVAVVVLSLRPVLERLERLELARRQIEAVHAREAVVLGPALAVHAGVQGTRHVDLRVVLVDLGRQAKRLELLGLAVELRDRALVHHADPEVMVAVEANRERAGRYARLQTGHAGHIAPPRL